MPSSHVCVSPLAERTSSAPTVASMRATVGQKRRPSFIPVPQDNSAGRTAVHLLTRYLQICCTLILTNFDFVLAFYQFGSRPETFLGRPASIRLFRYFSKKSITNVSRQKLSSSQTES